MQRVTVLSLIILPYAIVSKEQEGGLAVKGQKSLHSLSTKPSHYHNLLLFGFSELIVSLKKADATEYMTLTMSRFIGIFDS